MLWRFDTNIPGKETNVHKGKMICLLHLVLVPDLDPRSYESVAAVSVPVFALLLKIMLDYL